MPKGQQPVSEGAFVAGKPLAGGHLMGRAGSEAYAGYRDKPQFAGGPKIRAPKPVVGTFQSDTGGTVKVAVPGDEINQHDYSRLSFFK